MARSIEVAAWCAVAALGLAGCTGSDGTSDGGATEPVGVSFEIRAVAEKASVAELPDGAECAQTPLAPNESGWMCVDATSIAYLVKPASLTAADVATVEVVPSAMPGSWDWSLTVTLTDTGATLFEELTKQASEATPPANTLAVMVGGEVMSAPTVMEAITGGEFPIHLKGDEAEAQAMAAAIVAANGTSGAQE